MTRSHICTQLIIGSQFFVLAACGGMGKSVPENSQGSKAVARLSPSASVPQASKEKKEALQLFKEGVKAYRSGNKAKARSLFEEAADVRSDFVEAIFNVGLIYWELGEESDALEWFEKASKGKAKIVDGLAARATKELGTGNQRAAEALLRQAVAQDAYNSPANLNLAQIARKRGDVQMARKLVRTALKQDEKNPDAYAVLARIYYDQKRFELAKLVCQSGIEIEPKAARLHNTLGLLYLQKDDQTRAVRSFVTAVKADGKFVPARLNLGALALGYKDFPLAYRQFKAVVDLEPKNVMALLSLGVAARSLNKIDEAEKHYRSVLAIDAANIGAAYNLGVLFADYRKSYTPALQLFSEVMRRAKDPKLRKRTANRIEVLRIQIESERQIKLQNKAQPPKPTTKPAAKTEDPKGGKRKK